MSLRFHSVALLTFISMAVAVGVVLGLSWQQHGLIRTLSADNGYSHTGRWLWPYVDGADFERMDGLNNVNRVQFEGVVRRGQASTTTWRVVYAADVTVWINGDRVVDEQGTGEIQHVDVPVHWQNDWLELEILYQPDILDATTRLYFGIYEQNAVGRWQLLPGYRLFPQVPQQATRPYAPTVQTFATVALMCLGVLLGGVLVSALWQVRADKRVWLVLAVTVIALLVRLIVMAERATHDPYFYYLTPGGDDNYTVMGRQLLSGQYNLAGTFWPSLPILWSAGISVLFGPHLEMIYVMNILLSTLSTTAVICAGWLAFSRNVGLFSGVIYALYPPLIFYQASTQSIVLDAALVSGAMLLGVMTLQDKTRTSAILFGVCLGLGGLSRGTILLLGPAFFLALVLARHPQWLRLTAIAAMSAVVVLAPQLLLNWQATGKASITPYSNGALTLYSGNNRDADGLWTGRGTAWELEYLRGRDWNSAMMADAQADPLRVVELFLRKVAIFFNNDEQVSNMDYQRQGLPHSALLRVLSLNGMIGMWAVTLLTLTGGVLLLLRERHMDSRFIFWSGVFSILGAALFVIAGRLRIPAFPLMILCCGYAVSYMLDVVRRRRPARLLITSALFALFCIVLFQAIEEHLPRPRYNADAPAIQQEKTFVNGLQSLGFNEIITDHASYVYVSLVWHIPQSLDEDLTVFVEVADEMGRVAGVDRAIGSQRYPFVPTSQWPAGAKVEEGYLILLPDDISASSLHLNMGVYETDTYTPLPRVDTGQVLTRLSGLGIRTESALSAQADTESIIAVFEDALQLRAVEFPSTALCGEAVTLQMIWQSTRYFYEDVIIFLHLLEDGQDEPLAQIDDPELTPGRTTSTLIPGVLKTSLWTLSLPDAISAGEYQVVLGAYRWPSIQRLQVVDGTSIPYADDKVELGTLTILEDCDTDT